MRTPPRGFTRIQATRPEFDGGFRLTVPASVARLVGPDRLFKVELTDEGILYRYVEGDGPELPDWLKGTS